MAPAAQKRNKLSDRINAYVGARKPLRAIAGNWSKTAQVAIDEASSLSLERVSVALHRLPKKLEGFRIIHLSDIHHSPFTDLHHIERTIKIVNRLRPDLIVLTGDYVSHEAEYIRPVAEALGKLRSRFGTFACLGNHDHWTDAALVSDSFREQGIRVLINEGVRINAHGASFWLAGVDDYMVGKTDVPAAMRGSYPDELKLLLAHNPIIFRQSIRAKVDLTFSGHTHGGQIKLRESEKRLIRRRKLSSGLHERSGSQIYITRGIGTVVLPVRYQCPPEISLLELRCNE